MALVAYDILKSLHVLLAITAVGANITYGIWLSRTARNPQHLAYVLRTIKFIDDRIANPGYGLLLLTGLGMVTLGPYRLTTPWLLVSLVLYVMALVLGLAMYTPVLRRQIVAVEKDGPDSAEYIIAAAQGRQLGIILAVLVVIIVFLMVYKPSFGLSPTL